MKKYKFMKKSKKKKILKVKIKMMISFKKLIN